MNFIQVVVLSASIYLALGAPSSESPQNCSCLLGHLLLVLSDLIKNQKACDATPTTTEGGDSSDTTVDDLFQTSEDEETTTATPVGDTTTTILTTPTPTIATTTIATTTIASTNSTAAAITGSTVPSSTTVAPGSGSTTAAPNQCGCQNLTGQLLVPVLRFEGKPDSNAFQFYLNCLLNKQSHS